MVFPMLGDSSSPHNSSSALGTSHRSSARLAKFWENSPVLTWTKKNSSNMSAKKGKVSKGKDRLLTAFLQRTCQFSGDYSFGETSSNLSNFTIPWQYVSFHPKSCILAIYQYSLSFIFLFTRTELVFPFLGYLPFHESHGATYETLRARHVTVWPMPSCSSFTGIPRPASVQSSKVPTLHGFWFAGLQIYRGYTLSSFC